MKIRPNNFNIIPIIHRLLYMLQYVTFTHNFKLLMFVLSFSSLKRLTEEWLEIQLSQSESCREDDCPLFVARPGVDALHDYSSCTKRHLKDYGTYPAIQRQTEITAYFLSKQFLMFAPQYIFHCVFYT